MYLYHWDSETKEFLGVSPARIDPLESDKKRETIYLQGSPFTTYLCVPYFEKNEIPVWDGGKWNIEKDYRGQTVYNKETSEPFIVSKIGSLPEEYTEEKPEEFEEWKDGKWKQSLKKAINKKIETLSLFASEKKNSVVFWGTKEVPTDTNHWLELYRKKIFLEKQNSEISLPWKISNNTWIELNSKNVGEIFELIENFYFNCDLNEFKHLKAIQELTSIEDVRAYNFKTGW